MAATQAATVTVDIPRAKRRRIAGAIVTGHGFQHMYADGFLVLLPAIYDAFGLTPVSAGIMSLVRQSSGGIMTMGGGFVVDMFSGRRGLLLAGSLFAIGLGYLIVGAAPNYGVLLAALALGSAAGSFWHPVGLGLLSHIFPRDRAFVFSLHRSAGSLGETVTPLVVGLVLAFITWREVLLAGFILIAVVALALYVLLRKLGLPEEVTERRSAGEQLRSIGQLFTSRALPALLLMSGLRGMADRALVFFLPLFIAQSLRQIDPGVTDARIALVVGYHLFVFSIMGIVVPPLLGALSDRIGRRPVIIWVLVASTIVLGLLTRYSTIGTVFTLLIGTLGALRFAVANLTQAGALDIAEGRRLEGSMIGLLWGNNAFFGSLSPLVAGFLMTLLADGGENNFAIIFPYSAVLTGLAIVAALFVPSIGGRKGQSAVTA